MYYIASLVGWSCKARERHAFSPTLIWILTLILILPLILILTLTWVTCGEPRCRPPPPPRLPLHLRLPLLMLPLKATAHAVAVAVVNVLLAGSGYASQRLVPTVDRRTCNCKLRVDPVTRGERREERGERSESQPGNNENVEHTACSTLHVISMWYFA